MPKTTLIILGQEKIYNHGDCELTNLAPNVVLKEGASLLIGCRAPNLHYPQTVTIEADDGKMAGLLYPNQISKVQGINCISVKFTATFNVISNQLPLEEIETVDHASLNLRNNYYGQVKAKVNVGENCIINLTGADLPISSVTLNENSIFSFYHKNKPYQFNTLNYNLELLTITIEDPHRLADVSDFIKANYKVNEEGFQVALNKVGGLKAYQATDKKVLKAFMTQQNIDCDFAKIDNYINQHGLEFTVFAHDLHGSSFENIPPSVIGEIFSHFNLSDVLL